MPNTCIYQTLDIVFSWTIQDHLRNDSRLMAPNDLQPNGTNGELKDPQDLLPGITVPEKVDSSATESQLLATEEPESFPGPDVNGRPTVVTKFTPTQLAKSSLVKSLYNTINQAFHEGHRQSGHLLVDRARLRTDNQLFDELGNAPGTITYVVYYKDTQQVVATASGKRYLGRAHIVEKDLTQEQKWANTWKRFGLLEPGTAAWELSTMAVDPNSQKQGLAGYLMKLVDVSHRRRR